MVHKRRKYMLIMRHHLSHNSINTKIRRIVCQTLENDTKLKYTNKHIKCEVDGLDQMMDSSKPLAVRIVWGIIWLSCLGICVLQCWTRVAYFLSEPVAVDVKIIAVDKVEFPGFSIFAGNPNGLQILIEKLGRTGLGTLECFNPLLPIFEKGKDMTAMDVWNLQDSNELFEGAQLVTRTKRYNVTRMKEYFSLGIGATLEFEGDVSYGGTGTMLVVTINTKNLICEEYMIIGTVQPVGLPPDLSVTWGFVSGSTLEFSLTLMKYEFVSRREAPCTDSIKYFQCRKQCSIEASKHYPCRFPFMPEELKMPPCILTGNETLKKFYTTVSYQAFDLECKCPRRCDALTFSSGMNYIRKNKEPISILSWYFDHNRMMIIKERFSYDAVSLMSDIGGNLGLCLGLSILSIVKITHEMLNGLKKYRTYKKKYMPDMSVIGQQVRHLLNDELQRIQNLNNKKILSKFGNPSLQMFISILIVLTSLVCSCLFIYIRLTTYWAIPTNIVVEILDHKMVHFPVVTICGYSRDIIKVFRKMAKVKKKYRNSTTGSTKTLDWCALQLPDLLDIPNVSADVVWSVTSVYKEFSNSLEVGEIVFGTSLVKNITSKEVFLPEGKCMEYTVGKQKHIGTGTMFSKVTNSLAFNTFENDMIECQRHYYSVYLTPPNALFHLNTRLFAPYGRRTQFILEYQKVTRLNLPKSPCSNLNTFNLCYARCFYRILFREITQCRLPYMPKSFNLSTCSTGQSARNAQKAYLDFALTFDPLQYKECGCVQTCEETIVKCVDFTEPQNLEKNTLIIVGYFTNIQQHFKQVQVDNLSRVISDIGGNLGLTLGVSLLSLFKIFESLGSKVFSKLMPKRKSTQQPQHRQMPYTNFHSVHNSITYQKVLHHNTVHVYTP